MANAVNYLSQIQTGQTIQAVHVNQFVNALSGSQAYDLTISGSLTVIGPLNATASLAISANTAVTASYVLNAVSSSFASTASFVRNAVTASYVLNAVSSSFASTGSVSNKPFIALNASSNVDYTLVFKNDAGALNDYYQLAADGTNGPYYNPSTNILGGLGGLTVSGSIGRFTSITGSVLGNVNGTASFATTASYALTASVAQQATTAEIINGFYIPSGSIVSVAGALKMFAGASKTTGTIAVVTVSPIDLTGKILGQNLFLGIAPSQSNSIVSATLNSPTSITFESTIANTDFTFIATYI